MITLYKAISSLTDLYEYQKWYVASREHNKKSLKMKCSGEHLDLRKLKTVKNLGQYVITNSASSSCHLVLFGQVASVMG
jgi:hypothetical protein